MSLEEFCGLRTIGVDACRERTDMAEGVNAPVDGLAAIPLVYWAELFDSRRWERTNLGFSVYFTSETLGRLDKEERLRLRLGLLLRLPSIRDTGLDSFGGRKSCFICFGPAFELCL